MIILFYQSTKLSRIDKNRCNTLFFFLVVLVTPKSPRLKYLINIIYMDHIGGMLHMFTKWVVT